MGHGERSALWWVMLLNVALGLGFCAAGEGQGLGDVLGNPPGEDRETRSEFAQMVEDLAVAKGSTGLGRWSGAHPEWQGIWSEERNQLRALFGPSFSAFPGAPENVDLLDPEALSPETLDEIADAFGFRLEHLRWHSARRIRDLYRLEYRQVIRGGPVLGSYLRVIVGRTGRIVALFGAGLDSATCEKLPRWPMGEASGEAAWRRALRELGPLKVVGLESGWWSREVGDAPRAVMVATVHDLRPELSAMLIFDLLEGNLLERRGLVVEGTVTRGSVVGNSVSGWNANTPAAKTLPFPLPHLAIAIEGLGTTVTDAYGRFFLPEGAPGRFSATATLSGPFVTVTDAAGENASITRTLAEGSTTQLLLNTSETVRDNAEVNAFVHVNRMHDWVTGILVDPPFVDLDFPMAVGVNTGGACNAFFIPTSLALRFVIAGSGCVNTAYSTPIYHEYMHAIAFSIFGTLFPSDMHEGIADAAAALVAGDRVVGRDFRGPGDHLREVESDLVFPASGTVHTRGLVVAGAIWDLRSRLIHQFGPEEGARLTEEIWLHSLFFLPSGINADMVLTLLLADDDDGDLGNGTPHDDAIREAFASHGLALEPLAVPPLKELRDSQSGRAAEFTWSFVDPYDNIVVEKDGRRVEVLDGDATSWVDPDISPGIHTYLFRGILGGQESPAVLRWIRNERFLRGDADGDGVPNIADAWAILQFIYLHGPGFPCMDAADVNDSGTLHISDPIHLVTYLFHDGPPPPSPYPEVGTDASVDFIPCAGEL